MLNATLSVKLQATSGKHCPANIGKLTAELSTEVICLYQYRTWHEAFEFCRTAGSPKSFRSSSPSLPTCGNPASPDAQESECPYCSSPQVYCVANIRPPMLYKRTYRHMSAVYMRRQLASGRSDHHYMSAVTCMISLHMQDRIVIK